MDWMSRLFCCISQSQTNSKAPRISQEITTVDTRQDMVYMRIYETHKYELDMKLVKTWMFDTKLTCLFGKDETDTVYAGKSLMDMPMFENYIYWENILCSTLDDHATKQTIIFKNEMVYVETKPLYYSTDITEIYGVMLIIIPYRPKKEFQQKRPVSMDAVMTPFTSAPPRVVKRLDIKTDFLLEDFATSTGIIMHT